MIRRYDLRRSDNYPYTGKRSYACNGDGYLFIETGFPVKSVIISWASVPFYNGMPEFSSSSESTSSSSSLDSSSSSSSKSLSSKSSSTSSSKSSSTSSLDSSSTSSTSSSSTISSSTRSWSTTSSSSTSGDTQSSFSTESDLSYSSLSSSTSSTSSDSSLSSNPWPGPFITPRIYIWSTQTNGFTVRYENIPEELGYFEFMYMAI